MTTVTERVAAGVVWLDANSPGWRGKIAISDLEMSSSCSCVIGQVFGNYSNVIQSMGHDMGINANAGKGLAPEDLLSHTKATALGFDISGAEQTDDGGRMSGRMQYEELRGAWLKELSVDGEGLSYREQRWAPAPGCTVVHPYGEDGWRPGVFSPQHEHLVVVDVTMEDLELPDEL
jgi:hypothetical protein